MVFQDVLKFNRGLDVLVAAQTSLTKSCHPRLKHSTPFPLVGVARRSPVPPNLPNAVDTCLKSDALMLQANWDNAPLYAGFALCLSGAAA